MKRIILALIAIGSCTAVTLAQDVANEPQLGLRAGLNVSQLKMFRDVPAGYEAGWSTGAEAGVFGNIPVGERVSLQLEANYSFLGGKIVRGRNSSELDQDIHYVGIPLLVKLHASAKTKILAGGQWSIMMDAKSTDGLTGVTTANKERWRGDDLSLIGGMEYWLSDKWLLGGRYVHGIQSLNTTNPGYKNRVVQLTLGCRLGK